MEETTMRDGMYIVDGDGHVLDGQHLKRYLPQKYQHRAGSLFPTQGWDRRQAPNGDLGRSPSTPEEQIADIDQEGIDLQVLYPTANLNIGELRDPEMQVDLARAYNSFVSDFCGEAPNRFKAVAAIPVL